MVYPLSFLRVFQQDILQHTHLQFLEYHHSCTLTMMGFTTTTPGALLLKSFLIASMCWVAEGENLGAYATIISVRA
jgi:hypothetical protein